MPELIKGIHHIALKASGLEEFEKTIIFYRDVLGMKEIRRFGEGAESGIMLEANGLIMEIFANGEDSPGEGAIRHFAFATDNVDGCAEAVCKAGYEVYVEPRDIVIRSNPEYPARIAFCTGPVGEVIEFFEER